MAYVLMAGGPCDGERREVREPLPPILEVMEVPPEPLRFDPTPVPSTFAFIRHTYERVNGSSNVYRYRE